MRYAYQRARTPSPAPDVLPFIRANRPLLTDWEGPTFGEFLDRVQHQFGSAADLSTLLLMGLGRDERLAPSDIEALCMQLGIPAEDFGVGP